MLEFCFRDPVFDKVIQGNAIDALVVWHPDPGIAGVFCEADRPDIAPVPVGVRCIYPFVADRIAEDGDKFIVAGLVSCSTEGTGETAADTLLLDGKILTVDDAFSIAEALAIKGEQIMAVGSTEDILRHIGPSTRFVDLDGATVLLERAAARRASSITRAMSAKRSS